MHNESFYSVHNRHVGYPRVSRSQLAAEEWQIRRRAAGCPGEWVSTSASEFRFTTREVRHMTRLTTNAPILQMVDIQGPRIIITVRRYVGSRCELLGTTSLHVSVLEEWLNDHAKRTAEEQDGLFETPRF